MLLDNRQVLRQNALHKVTCYNMYVIASQMFDMEVNQICWYS